MRVRSTRRAVLAVLAAFALASIIGASALEAEAKRPSSAERGPEARANATGAKPAAPSPAPVAPGGTAAPGGTVTPGVTAAPVATAAPSPAPVAPGGTAEPDAGAKTNKKKALFKGIVQNDKGEPLAGATVTLVSVKAQDSTADRALPGGGGPGIRAFRIERRPRPGPDEEAPVFFSGKTEQAGSFTVEAEGDGPFNLRVEAPGFAPTIVEKVSTGEAPGALRMARGFRAMGVVADLASGAPVVDAEVIARAELDKGFDDPSDPKRFAPSARTGRNGSFTINDLAANFYTFRVSAAGRALFEAEGKPIGEAKSEPLAFYLEPGFDLPGRVLGPAGKPVEGTPVYAVPSRRSGVVLRAMRGASITRPMARTDKEGRFTLKGVPTEGKYSLDIRTKEYAPFNMEIAPPRSGASVAASVEVHLEKGVILKARLIDPDQKPVTSGIEVTLAYRDVKTRRAGMTVLRTGKEVHFGPTGELTLERLPAGNARVQIEAEGFKEVAKPDVPIGRDPKGTDLGTIALDRGKKIDGKVVDGDGNPIASAKVSLSGGPPGRGGRQLSTKTNTSGRFTFGGLDEGTFTIEASASGFATASKGDISLQGEPVEIALVRAGSLKGRVVAGDPPKPVTNFSVEAAPKESGGRGGGGFGLRIGGGTTRKQSNPSGAFTLDGLVPGAYTVTFKADGLQDLVREGVDVTGGEANDLGDLTLSAGGTIRGRVQSQPEGLPVAGASVRVKKPSLFNLRGMLGGEDVTLTDLAGRFEIRGLPVGQTTLVVEPENYAKTEVAGVLVEEGTGGDEIVVNVGKGGRVEGRVLGSDGTLQSGTTVSATAGLFDFSARLTAITDDQGHYAIENVSPGSYRVTTLPFPTGDEEAGDTAGGAGGGGRFSGLDSISTEVKDGKTSIVNFGEKKIKVAGSIKRKSGSTGGMQVLFLPDNSIGPARLSLKMTTADEAGHYEVSLNEPGEYMVRVGQPDSVAGAMIKVTVPDKPDFSYDIVFPEGVVSGRVTDEANGSPLKGVTVIAAGAQGTNPRPRGGRGRGANTASTGEDGSYRIEGLTPGSWDLSFVHDGYGTEARSGIEVKGSDEVSGIDQIMSSAAPFKVRVQDPSGAPVQGALVFVSQGGAPVSGVGGLTREDGTIETKQLKPGTYSFHAVTRELAPGIARDVSVGGEKDSDTVIVTLTTGGAARIVVRDAGKQPISGASVTLASPSEPDLDTALETAMTFGGGRTSTGADGVLSIQHLPPGKYEATITKGDKKISKSVTVEEGATGELTVTLE